MYFWCVFFPPLAVLMTGRFGSFLVNCLLTVCTLGIGGMIHAFAVCSDYKAQQRQREMMAGMAVAAAAGRR